MRRGGRRQIDQILPPLRLGQVLEEVDEFVQGWGISHAHFFTGCGHKSTTGSAVNFFQCASLCSCVATPS